MKKREEIIEEMCRHYREDYLEERKSSDPPWVRGLTTDERENLRKVMSNLYDKIMSHYEHKK